MRIVLLGAPGAGKGTQGVRLAARFGLSHIATGALLRRILETEPGSERAAAARVIQEGRMVSDTFASELVFDALARPEARPGFVLDGYPRNVAQASALESLLAQRERPLDAAVSLEVPASELLRRFVGRLSCPRCGASFHETSAPPRVSGRCDRCGGALEARADDAAEAVAVRLALYAERTAPVVRFYADRGLLRAVDASADPERVFERICGVLPVLI